MFLMSGIVKTIPVTKVTVGMNVLWNNDQWIVGEPDGSDWKNMMALQLAENNIKNLKTIVVEYDSIVIKPKSTNCGVAECVGGVITTNGAEGELCKICNPDNKVQIPLKDSQWKSVIDLDYLDGIVNFRFSKNNNSIPCQNCEEPSWCLSVNSCSPEDEHSGGSVYADIRGFFSRKIIKNKKPTKKRHKKPSVVQKTTYTKDEVAGILISVYNIAFNTGYNTGYSKALKDIEEKK